MLAREEIEQKMNSTTKTVADFVLGNADKVTHQTAVKVHALWTSISIDVEKMGLLEVCRHSVTAHDAISCDSDLIVHKNAVTSDRHFLDLLWLPSSNTPFGLSCRPPKREEMPPQHRLHSANTG